MKKWGFLVVAVLVLVRPAASQTDFPTLGREIETLVRKRFYDAGRGEGRDPQLERALSLPAAERQRGGKSGNS